MSLYLLGILDLLQGFLITNNRVYQAARAVRIKTKNKIVLTVGTLLSTIFLDNSSTVNSPVSRKT